MREAAICLAAVLSMCMPGLAAFAYRRQSGEGDWDLSPVPTVLGWVDSRRFAAFSLVGGGRLATWQDEDESEGEGAGDLSLAEIGVEVGMDFDSDSDSGGDSGNARRGRGRGADIDVMPPPAPRVLQNAADTLVEKLTNLHLPAHLCHDTWKGPVYFYPRKLHRRLQELLRGESERHIEAAIARASRSHGQPEPGSKARSKARSKDRKKGKKTKKPTPV